MADRLASITRTYRGAARSWRSRSHAWTIDGRMLRTSKPPKAGNRWTLRRLATASRVEGSNVWLASQSAAKAPKVTRPAEGST